MFCVVEFMEEKSVEVVPDNWIDEKNDMCWWPARKTESEKIKRMVKTSKQPDESFIKFQFRLIKKCGKF